LLKTSITASGDVIATDVSFEDFLTQFDGQSVEWINGVVIRMSPVSQRHNELTVFLITLFDFFLPLTGGGRIFHEPMVMRPNPDLPGRTPDVMIVLPGNFGIIQENQLDGPADLVIEVVSPESHRRDRFEKFAEYEQGGVREYWILDPVRRESLFYIRNDQGIFEPREPDEQQIYHSLVLPKLRLDATIFWRNPLPRGPEIAQLVTEMLKA
jgi:Uma2 family endonuclease